MDVCAASRARQPAAVRNQQLQAFESLQGDIQGLFHHLAARSPFLPDCKDWVRVKVGICPLNRIFKNLERWKT